MYKCWDYLKTDEKKEEIRLNNNNNKISASQTINPNYQQNASPRENNYFLISNNLNGNLLNSYNSNTNINNNGDDLSNNSESIVDKFILVKKRIDDKLFKNIFDRDMKPE